MKKLLSLMISISIASLTTIAVGCNGSTTNATKPPAVNNPKPEKVVALKEGNVKEISEAAAEIKDAVVLIEFWSTSTEPANNLALVSNSRGGGIEDNQQNKFAKDKVAWHGIRKAQYMAQKYEGYFLKVVSVNIDGEDKKEDVLKHLNTYEARHVTSILLNGDVEAVKAKYGYNGKAPYQVVLSRKGEKVWSTGENLVTNLDSLIFAELDK